MKHDAIETIAEYLKCDALGCDHHETVAAMTADLIGKQCPKCGSNLLTEQDFNTYSEHSKIMAAINKIIGPVEVPDGQKMQVVSYNPHGSKITIEIERDVEA